MRRFGLGSYRPRIGLRASRWASRPACSSPVRVGVHAGGDDRLPRPRAVLGCARRADAARRRCGTCRDRRRGRTPRAGLPSAVTSAGRGDARPRIVRRPRRRADHSVRGRSGSSAQCVERSPTTSPVAALPGGAKAELQVELLRAVRPRMPRREDAVVPALGAPPHGHGVHREAAVPAALVLGGDVQPPQARAQVVRSGRVPHDVEEAHQEADDLVTLDDQTWPRDLGLRVRLGEGPRRPGTRTSPGPAAHSPGMRLQTLSGVICTSRGTPATLSTGPLVGLFARRPLAGAVVDRSPRRSSSARR